MKKKITGFFKPKKTKVKEKEHLEVWHDIIKEEVLDDYGKIGYLIDYKPQHRRGNIRILFQDDLRSARVLTYQHTPLCVMCPECVNHKSNIECEDCPLEIEHTSLQDFYDDDPETLALIVKFFVKTGVNGLDVYPSIAFPELAEKVWDFTTHDNGKVIVLSV